MIFLGDLACPDNRIDAFLDCINSMELFRDEIIVINLEANIVDNKDERKILTLYNNSKIVNSFGQAKKVIVSLANNHMYDYPGKILPTKESLENAGIGVFGLYEGDKILPFEYTDVNGKTYAFFGHCWCVYTNTNKNTENDIRVVDCPYDEFLDIIRSYISTHPGVEVYCFMHWNYDLEKYPFPVLRILAHKLIDCGISGVIGSHSHRPQGIEIYKGVPIAYCLGNFYLPSGCYFDGKLCYPDFSKTTYGIKIGKTTCDRVWFDTDTDKNIPVMLKQIDEDIIHNHDVSDYINMSERDYLLFYKKNRIKKVFVPVFDEFEGAKLKRQEQWAITRVKILRYLKGVFKK